MNDADDAAIRAAIASTGRPMARKAASTRPRSATATNAKMARTANAARPAIWEARFRCSCRCRIPARDHINAASAM